MSEPGSSNTMAGLAMSARSMLRQARCPECHYNGMQGGTGKCNWCRERAALMTAILGGPDEFVVQPPASETSDVENLRAALAMVYDKWEDGTPSYQDPEDYTGYLGMAFKLTQKEEAQILALLPPRPTQKANEQHSAHCGHDTQRLLALGWARCPNCDRPLNGGDARND